MKTLSPLSPSSADDFISSGAGETQIITLDAQKAKNVCRKRLELRKLNGNPRNGTTIQVQTISTHYSKHRHHQQSDEDEAPTSKSSSSNASPSTSSENLAKLMARKAALNCLSYGTALMIGRRREMEDAVRVERGFAEVDSKKFDFYGVFDGHGGAMVAEACRHRMHQILVRELEDEMAEGKKAVESGEGAKGGVNWEEVMVRCYDKMDREVGGGHGPKDEGEEMTVGSTAVTAVISKEAVVVANCGDSRAVICRNGVAVPLSVDHKPDRPDELARIEAAGGRVINWNGARVLGVLAASRSIGDNYLKPFVISKPDVTVCERTSDDEFMILATDGLWDVVSNEIACQVVRKCLCGRLRAQSAEPHNGSASRTRASDAAAFLANLAMAKGSRDNISIVVVELKRFRRFTTS